MKRFLPFSLFAAAALILAACGLSAPAQRAMESGGAPETYYDNAAPPLPTMMPAAMPAAEAPSSGGGGVEAASVERLIIQNADIAVVVSDVEVRLKEIETMAAQMGGFVVTSNLYKSFRNNVEAPEATLTIRVPAERLEEALNRIKENAVEVQSETRSGQDVTAQYVDLKSRLKNLEAAEAQLTEIMGTATDIEDVVNIFNQLVYYREQIEIVKGQMKYYEEAAALSAVNIRIIAKETVQPIQIGKWEPQGVAREAIQDLINFWKDFVDFVIRFTLYTLPVLVTVGAPLYFVLVGFRALFRRMRGRRRVEAKAEEEKK
jgi:hypothetical protein